MHKEKKPLTQKQLELYNFIKDRKHWSPPSMDQVAKSLNYRNRQAVFEHIQAIKAKGYKIPRGYIAKQKPLS